MYAKVKSVNSIPLGAGIILTSFDPTECIVSDDSIVCATTGGISISCVPSYSDIGESVKNCVHKTMELKHLDSWECKMSFVSLNTSPEFIKKALGAADVSEDTCMIVPRRDVSTDDFSDIWWVGDRLDGGVIAIQLCNALSTSGIKLSTQKNGKGQLSVELIGHFVMDDPDAVPMVFYSLDIDDSDSEETDEEIAYLNAYGLIEFKAKGQTDIAKATRFDAAGNVTLAAIGNLVAKLIKLLKVTAEESIRIKNDAVTLFPAAALDVVACISVENSNKISVAKALHTSVEGAASIKSEDEISVTPTLHIEANGLADIVSDVDIASIPTIHISSNEAIKLDSNADMAAAATFDISASSNSVICGKSDIAAAQPLYALNAKDVCAKIMSQATLTFAGIESGGNEEKAWAVQDGTTLYIYRASKAEQDNTALYIDKSEEEAWAQASDGTLTILQAYVASQDGSQLTIS